MENDRVFHQKTLDLFRSLIHQETGITISKEKDYLLNSKLARMLKGSAYGRLEDLYPILQGGHEGEKENLIKAVTTNHTFFFREKNHLSILRKDIQAKRLASPRIWVAASSSGEEVYSIIIELLEAGIRDFRILASDINREMLVRMKQGVYGRHRFHEVPPHLLTKYFASVDTPGGTAYRVKDFLKPYFVAKKLNLMDLHRFEGQFDYIFCRNVLIYFNQDTQRPRRQEPFGQPRRGRLPLCRPLRKSDEPVSRGRVRLHLGVQQKNAGRFGRPFRTLSEEMRN